jgi:hypothetical protein
MQGVMSNAILEDLGESLKCEVFQNHLFPLYRRSLRKSWRKLARLESKRILLLTFNFSIYTTLSVKHKIGKTYDLWPN